MRLIVTGTAGFIGAAVAVRLLERGDEVLGVDNLNDYYDVGLKRARLARFEKHPRYSHLGIGIEDAAALRAAFESQRPERVVHLAAQAGVRYSLENPGAYVTSNLVAFANILECCRHLSVEHLVYASSSSVYGDNARAPYSVHDNVDHPISLYAATKKSNELMAHCYSHLHRLPTTGLRFFTVYGPWGRPDMSPFQFVRKILAGEPIDVYNHGHHQRDFTYIDDVVEGVLRVLDRVARPDPEFDPYHPDPASSHAPYRLYNLGGGRPVELMRYIEVIERSVGKKAIKNMLPRQPGDVLNTSADLDSLVRDIGYKPEVSLEVGVARFVEWYREHYRV